MQVLITAARCWGAKGWPGLVTFGCKEIEEQRRMMESECDFRAAVSGLD